MSSWRKRFMFLALIFTVGAWFVNYLVRVTENIDKYPVTESPRFLSAEVPRKKIISPAEAPKREKRGEAKAAEEITHPEVVVGEPEPEYVPEEGTTLSGERSLDTAAPDVVDDELAEIIWQADRNAGIINVQAPEVCMDEPSAESEAAVELPPVTLDEGASREEPSAQPTANFFKTLKEGTSVSLRFVGWRSFQELSLGFDSENALLRLPRETEVFETRADLTAVYGPLLVSTKLRLSLERSLTEIAGELEQENKIKLRFPQAKVAWTIMDTLTLIGGREVLDSGPAWFFNPSDPFQKDNGRGNPMFDVLGKDYLRAVWQISPGWSISAIANIGPGEKDKQTAKWQPAYALKADYTGEKSNAGALIHIEEGHSPSLRGYVQRTASDALLIYGEVNVLLRNDAEYPVRDPNSPLGYRLERKEGVHPNVVANAGASYTLEIGPTLTAEYLFNQKGNNARQAEGFFDIAHTAGALTRLGILSGKEIELPEERFLRRHYLFLQYQQSDIGKKLDLIIRYIHNLDDQSGNVTGYAELKLGDRWSLVGSAGWWAGGNRQELGSAIRAFGLIGLTAFIY